MKLIAIGDIHGCREELEEMMIEINRKHGHEEKIIIFLGDYIDRGPDSKGVLDICMGLEHTDLTRYVFLLGNHEDMMLNDQGSFYLNGGVQTLRSFGTNAVHDIDLKYIRWLRVLEPYYQFGKYVFVHAGLNPDVSLKDHNVYSLIWERRYNNHGGQYKDGSFVVHGHTPGYNIKEYTSRINIDTACVFGGHLTAAIIDPSTDTIDYIQVKSKQKS